MTMKDAAAVVGIGATQYYRRGKSYPQESELSLACKAILAALEDAGLTIADLDGFAIYSDSCDPAEVAADARRARGPLRRGPHVGRRRRRPGRSAWPPPRSTPAWPTCVVTLMTLQQAHRRLGGDRGRDAKTAARSSSRTRAAWASLAVAGVHGERRPPRRPATASRRSSRSGTCTCTEPSASTSPRSRSRQRDNAIRRPDGAHADEPLTLDDYFNARMISDPLCLFDYTMETDGAVAVITTSAERAKDLRQPPVYIMGSAHGGTGRWGPAIFK